MSDRTTMHYYEAGPTIPATPEEEARADRALQAEVPSVAQRRLEQMRQTITRHQTTLQSERGTWRSTFDRARRWLSREDSVEVHLVQLTIEIDHLLDKIQDAAPGRSVESLLKQVQVLEERCQQLIKVEAALAAEGQPIVELTEAETRFEIQTAGSMKPNWLKDSKMNGKIGRFGQDCLRFDRKKGIGVVADGMSTGVDSYEVARRTSRQAERILQALNEDSFSTLDQVTQAIEQQLPAILNEVNGMEAFSIGGSTLLACRYLEKFDAVALIDLGDCEAGVVAGQDFFSLKNSSVDLKSPPNITKKQNGKASFSQMPAVTAVSLAEFRAAHPEQDMHLVMSTDGLKNNSKQSLEMFAQKITTEGANKVIDEVGSDKDDITLISLKLPKKHERQRLAA